MAQSPLKFYGYKACGTCRKAEKHLQEAGIPYTFVDITQQAPSVEELQMCLNATGLDVRKAFNTSGVVYKEGNYKDKIAGQSVETLLEWLAGNGRLVKRPMILGESKPSIGFKEEDFRQIWA
jgi:arsenate reductase